MESRIDNFLLDFDVILGNMTDMDFLRHRRSLANIKSTIPKTMADKMNTISREITSRRHNFHRPLIELAALDLITLKDLREFYNVSM